MKIIVLSLAAALTLSSAAAFAQTPAPAGGMSGPAAGSGMGGGRIPECRDDSQKYCAGKRGPDRRACLNDNKDKLSDACKSALAAAGN